MSGLAYPPQGIRATGLGSVIYGGTIILAAENTVGTVKHNVGSIALYPQITAMNDLGGRDVWVPPASNVAGTFEFVLTSLDFGTLGFYWLCGF